MRDRETLEWEEGYLLGEVGINGYTDNQSERESSKRKK